METGLSSLQPKPIWKFFDNICQIPRPSKKEGAIISFLKDFAIQRNLQNKIDASGNLLIKKPASKGYEKAPIVVLQSHVDMVCEKNASTEHNFDKDPIKTYIDGSWVKAKGTTLGADNGIGVAAMLAILDAKDLAHGPIECLFTVDEETGLTGAFGLEEGFFEGKILLNLDSEDEGTIFIGCAGGMTTTAGISLEFDTSVTCELCYRIDVKGLTGGHSGDDINKGLGNAIKVLTRILYQLNKKVDFQLIDLQGGNLHNAIAREAWSIITFPQGSLELAQSIIEQTSNAIKKELQATEKKLEILQSKSEQQKNALTNELRDKIIRILYALPHGATSMSKAIPGLVETSTNLASVKRKDDSFEIVTSQRSDSESLKQDIGNRVLSCFNLIGIEAKQSEGYPGWKPNPTSKVLSITKNSYKKLFDTEPHITAIHAGLECGLFLKKYPGLDMVSFGPTIKGAHSPDERVDIESVRKFWDHLLEVLKNISN